MKRKTTEKKQTLESIAKSIIRILALMRLCSNCVQNAVENV